MSQLFASGGQILDFQFQCVILLILPVAYELSMIIPILQTNNEV